MSRRRVRSDRVDAQMYAEEVHALEDDEPTDVELERAAGLVSRHHEDEHRIDGRRWDPDYYADGSPRW